jgi:hypothetical protein
MYNLHTPPIRWRLEFSPTSPSSSPQLEATISPELEKDLSVRDEDEINESFIAQEVSLLAPNSAPAPPSCTPFHSTPSSSRAGWIHLPNELAIYQMNDNGQIMGRSENIMKFCKKGNKKTGIMLSGRMDGVTARRYYTYEALTQLRIDAMNSASESVLPSTSLLPPSRTAASTNHDDSSEQTSIAIVSANSETASAPDTAAPAAPAAPASPATAVTPSTHASTIVAPSFSSSGTSLISDSVILHSPSMSSPSTTNSLQPKFIMLATHALEKNNRTTSNHFITHSTMPPSFPIHSMITSSRDDAIQNNNAINNDGGVVPLVNSVVGLVNDINVVIPLSIPDKVIAKSLPLDAMEVDEEEEKKQGAEAMPLSVTCNPIVCATQPSSPKLNAIIDEDANTTSALRRVSSFDSCAKSAREKDRHHHSEADIDHTNSIHMTSNSSHKRTFTNISTTANISPLLLSQCQALFNKTSHLSNNSHSEDIKKRATMEVNAMLQGLSSGNSAQDRIQALKDALEREL